MTSMVSNRSASTLWIMLLTLVSTVATLALACATPYAALAALAATRMRLPVFLHYCKKYALPVVMKKKKKHEVSAAAVVTMEKKDYDGRDLMACPNEQNLERRKEGGAKTEGRDALPVVPASVATSSV